MRSDRDLILDMLEMCELLIKHTQPDELAESPLMEAAAQRWIEVLGEAASHVSEDLKRAHPEVSWREIAGIRIILAHAYFHIDRDILGSVIRDDVPTLIATLRPMLDSLDDE